MYQTYEMGFSFDCLGHASGWDLGVLVDQKNKFSEHGHVAYQIKGDDQLTRVHQKFYPWIKLVTMFFFITGQIPIDFF